MSVYLPQTLEDLVRRGANVYIEDAGYLPQTIETLLHLARSSGSHITIKGNYLPMSLARFADIGRNNLTIIVSR